MKNLTIISLLIILVLVLSSCTEEPNAEESALVSEITQEQKEQTTKDKPSENTIDGPNKNTYILFTINTQDWVYPKESAETIKRIIKIHEKYSIPVDIYLNDQIFQYYAKDTDLIEMLTSSPIVAISYHVRVPHPLDQKRWFSDETVLNPEELSDKEIYSFLAEYERYKLDLASGLPDKTQAGGYQFIKDTIGYAPIIAPLKSDYENVAKVAADVYNDLGATWTLVHGKRTKIGDKKYGLFLRPEDVEIKYYDFFDEYDNGKTAEQIITESITKKGFSPGDDTFVNIKMHENNFIEGPSTAIYWDVFANDNKPPYDYKSAYDISLSWTDKEQEQMFQMYEDAIQYVSEHPTEYKGINAFDLMEMVE